MVFADNLFIILILMEQPFGQKLQIWVMKFLKSGLHVLLK